MTAFELLTEQPPPGPEIAPTCQCSQIGAARPVMLSIDAGAVSLHCPLCELSIGVDLEELHAEDLAMSMRTIVEKMPADNWTGFEIGAVWHELTAVNQ